MKVLVFDTETSSVPLWSQPSEHPGQPHVCQFTGVLFDSETGAEMEYVDLIVRQEWPVAAEAFAVHGITPGRSHAEGVPESHVVDHWEHLHRMADRVVGFSLNFDLRILRIACLRAGRDKAILDMADVILKPKCLDLAPKLTPLCKLPPTDKMMATGRKTFKTPKLEEAAEVLLGLKLGKDAHDARGDVMATKGLYEFLLERGLL